MDKAELEAEVERLTAKVAELNEVIEHNRVMRLKREREVERLKAIVMAGG